MKIKALKGRNISKDIVIILNMVFLDNFQKFILKSHVLCIALSGLKC